MNCEVVFERELFYGLLMKLLSATRRLVRLRPDRDDLMTIIDQPSQGRHGRFRCTHENDAHDCYFTVRMSEQKERGQAALPDLEILRADRRR